MVGVTVEVPFLVVALGAVPFFTVTLGVLAFELVCSIDNVVVGSSVVEMTTAESEYEEVDSDKCAEVFWF